MENKSIKKLKRKIEYLISDNMFQIELYVRAEKNALSKKDYYKSSILKTKIETLQMTNLSLKELIE